MEEIINGAIEIIDANENLVEKDCGGKKDLLCVKKDLLEKILIYIHPRLDRDIDRKEFLKKIVREAFELYDNDLVFMRNESIFIKLFDNSKVKVVEESQKDTVANRYSGLNEEDLQSFYDDFFAKDENNSFFLDVAKEFVNAYIFEKNINNITYEKFVFAYIQMIIADFLMDKFDHSEAFFKGFSGYVFRKHFNEVFEHIADLLLHEVGLSNKHVGDFLKYYSLNVIVVDGKKYKVPEIEARGGQKWNLPSMMSIAKIYIKTLSSLKSLKIKREALGREIVGMFIESRSPMEYNNEISAKIDMLIIEISDLSKDLTVYIDSLDIEKDPKKLQLLKEEIKEMKSEMSTLREEKAELEHKLVKRYELDKYNKLKKEMDILVRLERREERIVHQNKVPFMSIKNSLTKALMSKKVPI